MWIDIVGITLMGLIAIILVTTLEWNSIDPCGVMDINQYNVYKESLNHIQYQKKGSDK
jgi:hypothetical protein